MTTYRELVYFILDALKLVSDDAFYTEAHIMFLLNKMRAQLLEKKYGKAKAADAINAANYSLVKVDLEDWPTMCSYTHFKKSIKPLPEILNIGIILAYPFNVPYGEKMSFIPIERIPYVGNNRWLRGFMYAAQDTDKHIVVTGDHAMDHIENFIYLRCVFADPSELADFNDDDTDPMDMECPIEDALQPLLVEACLQELLGSRYIPYDQRNNARDDDGIGQAVAPKLANPERTIDAQRTDEPV